MLANNKSLDSQQFHGKLVCLSVSRYNSLDYLLSLQYEQKVRQTISKLGVKMLVTKYLQTLNIWKYGGLLCHLLAA